MNRSVSEPRGQLEVSEGASQAMPPMSEIEACRKQCFDLHSRFLERLLAARNEQGYWEGRLAPGALSTATAVIALTLKANAESTELQLRESCQNAIDRGLNWLCSNANEDGGFGDTTRNKTNISTTCVVWGCLRFQLKNDFVSAELRDAVELSVQRIEAWLIETVGSLHPYSIQQAILRRYGSDHTFSVPILMVLALAGILGDRREGWRFVPQLPFPLAALPQNWFKTLQLPVVSYAIPALIAIGQVRHHFYPGVNPIAWFIRNWAIEPTLKVLESVQPSNGGFLEATPLTSFVSMSLLAIGHADHPVVKRGVEFLLQSIYDDGSWPIDTHLATWATTLAIKGISYSKNHEWDKDDAEQLRAHLIKQQYREIHPYTGAEPGGWAWTHLPGGVPDGDDTAGALLALRALGCDDETVRTAILPGIRWLQGLQNRDGGIATFCRGFGTLPFDQSSSDISAHALLAWAEWLPVLDTSEQCSVRNSMTRILRYLARTQRRDGAFVPLWFGNEEVADDENPIYGTSRVLIALESLPQQYTESLNYEIRGILSELISNCRNYVSRNQNLDGSWGGERNTQGTVEETALAIEAIASRELLTPKDWSQVRGALDWLEDHVDDKASGIGLYFAKLWYFEESYPTIFMTSALSKLRNHCQ